MSDEPAKEVSSAPTPKRVALAHGPHLLECLMCFKKFPTATKFLNHLGTIDCYRPGRRRLGSIVGRALAG